MMTIDCMTQDISSSVRVRVTGFAAAHTFIKLYSTSEERGLKKSRTSRFELAQRNSDFMIHENISSMIIIFLFECICLAVSSDQSWSNSMSSSRNTKDCFSIKVPESRCSRLVRC